MNTLHLGPSSLPCICQCPCFQQQPKKLARTRLQLIGASLDNKLRLALQSPADISPNPDIEWAKNAILKKANGRKVHSRQQDCSFTYVHPGSGVEFRGEMDAFTDNQVFEFKSGVPHPYYSAQLLPYVAHLFERDESLESVEAHLVFSHCHLCRTTRYTRRGVEAELQAILAPWLAHDKKPRICQACEWCRHLNSQGGWDCMPASAPTLSDIFDFTLLQATS